METCNQDTNSFNSVAAYGDADTDSNEHLFMQSSPPQLQLFLMLHEAGMMFSRQKETKQLYQRKETVQCLWPEMERGLHRFHCCEWMHKETKDFAGDMEWKTQRAITELNPLICSLSRQYDVPSLPPLSQQQLRLQLFFLAHLYLEVLHDSNGIFKCNFHGKLQLLILALCQVALLRIKDKTGSRLQTAEY